MDALAARWDNTGESGVYYHPLHDANFNVTTVVSGSAAIQERYHYTPYGQVTFLDSSFANPTATSAINQENLYTGRQLDPETGLYYYRARYYHPVMGRFIGRDPIEYVGSEWNLYEYAESSPTINVDPSGEIIPVIIVGASCIACFEAMRAFLTAAHVICESKPDIGSYSACMISQISEMESSLDWYSWTVINTACLCCGGGITGAAKKFVTTLGKKWVARKIVQCKAIHTAYDALECRKCTGAHTKEELEQRIACFAAQVAGRTAYLAKKCDYVMPGSIARGSKIAEAGHKRQLVEKTAALAKCAAILAALQ